MIGKVRGRRAFQCLSRAGRRARTQSLWCSYLNDPAAVPLRVGFAVGRSIGTATRRNRLRRRLRAIVATAASAADLHAGVLLIGASPDALKRTFDDLHAEAVELLRQLQPDRPA